MTIFSLSLDFPKYVVGVDMSKYSHKTSYVGLVLNKYIIWCNRIAYDPLEVLHTIMLYNTEYIFYQTSSKSYYITFLRY